MLAPPSRTALCASPQIRIINALYVRKPQEVVRCQVIHFALDFALFGM